MVAGLKSWFISLGVKQYVLGVAAVFLVLTTWFLVSSYNDAIESAIKAQAEKAETEKALKVAEEERDKATKRTEQLDKALTEKSRYESQQRTELARLRQQDSELARSDPAVRSWLDTPVPGGLRRRTDAERGSDGLPPPTRGADRADARGAATDARRD